jgi:Domain of unknown function (DUF4158)
VAPGPPLSLGELVEHWTLVGDEVDLVSAKHLDTRLAFALLLKFYGRYGRFPRSRGEMHPDAVEFVARAVKADPGSVSGYDWSGRTIERHRGQIRRHFGFQVCGEDEGANLAGFLAGDLVRSGLVASSAGSEVVTVRLSHRARPAGQLI